TLTLANSGLPYPIRARQTDRELTPENAARQIELAGVPLGVFPGSTYEELCLDLQVGDLLVFCSDGIVEANDALQREFGTERLLKVIDQSRDKSAREIVDAIYSAVHEFRGDTPANDDMTAVAVKIQSLPGSLGGV